MNSNLTENTEKNRPEAGMENMYGESKKTGGANPCSGIFVEDEGI